MESRGNGQPTNLQQMWATANATSPSPSASPNASFQVSAPSISLPKGGGAICGIGEKFSANPVIGTGSMSVPIATSPGRSGFGPQLSLSYDSGAGNGPFGFGWSLSLPSITRKTEKGLPKYLDGHGQSADSDVFILSGAEDLVPEFEGDAQGAWVIKDGKHQLLDKLRTVNGLTYHVRRYRPRIEGLFARIERWTNTTNATDIFWRSISKDNITTWYGKTSESRIQDPTDRSRIFSWLICQSYDDKGNVIVYRYKEEDSDRLDLTQANERNRTVESRKANRYLKRISYGNREPYLPVLTETSWPQPPDQNPTSGPPNYYFDVVFDYEDGHYTEAAPDAEGRTFVQSVYDPPASAKWSRRVDPFSSYRSGFEVRTYRLCQRVLMFHHFPGELGTPDCLVRSTDLTYSYEDNPTDARNPIYSFLNSVSQSGYLRQGSTNTYLKKSRPPVEFDYTEPTVQDAVEEVDPESIENLPIGLDGNVYRWTDLHGEGIPGILTEQAGAWYYKRNSSPIPDTLPDGSEVVRAKFSALETVALKPNAALGGGAEFMDLSGDGQPDVVVMEGPTPGLYEHDEAEGWQPFRPFVSRLNRDLRDPNLKFIDLDGDGHADVLITEDDAMVWHPSLAEEGFGPAQCVAQALDEEKGPRVIFADGTQSIYLADLSGDGLTDIVRIRNGDVCYWPNLGYGRFGAKVTMDHAPWFDQPDLFDHQRLRLADIDGSGTTDIIYLHRDGVRLYFNQSGNSWSQPHHLKVFPRVDEIVSIVPTDLLGNGTACLVWSSPLPGDARRPMRYVNLMGGRKPHLLVKTINNLGAETNVQYAPSTKFYLQDKRDGRPWITRLPFPVHVVERVETLDHISHNRFVTRYAYHHGYFDGEEREFRGFGMVEQFDTEEFASLTGDGTLPPVTNIDAASHVPPVHTKTWFHTGVCLGRERISRHFEYEYFREPGLTVDTARPLLLDDTIVPPDLTLDEEREACRALKGSMLRQEVYADDAEPGATLKQVQRARTPYTVIEQNFTIRTVQLRGGNRHAVFFTHAREAISYHYERNPADPRIQHALTLEVDAYGNVLKQAAIGYGRRKQIRVVDDQGNVQQVPNPGLAGLDPTDQAKQTTPLLTYSETRITNAVESADTHCNPLPCETLTFELTGYTATGAAGRYQATDFVEPDPAVPSRLRHKFTDEVPYEAAATANPCRRSIEWLRTLYRSDDLNGLLPLGQLQSLALPGESYKLAFTPGLLAQVFQRPRQGQAPEPLLPNPAAVLGGQGGDRGGYLQSQSLKADGRFPATDADDHWWIPFGQSFFSTNPADPAAAEFTQARQHFFLPRRYRDPFSQDALVDFDAYDLLMVETRDALGNRVTVNANDYRVLQPRLVSDPNRNQTEVAFDTLGMVAGTAVRGKPSQAPVEGDLLTGFVADLTDAQHNDFFNATDPHTTTPTLLGNATTRIVYDLDRFWRTQQANPNDPAQWQPACAATLARETHVSDLQPGQQTKIQLSFSYSDGFGREIQKKIQAEPGPVDDNDPQAPVVSPRWVGSGWTIYNNKGKPVRQYEPFFSATHHFEFDIRIGVSPVLFYDPVERVVATLHPNHTWEKVVFDPWRQETWDVNDTALIADPKTDADVGDFFGRLSKAEYLPTWHAKREGGALGPEEQDAARKTAIHAATPTVAHADSLWRTVLTIAHNRFKYRNTPPADPPVEEFHHTRLVLDIEGNQREVIDAKDRIVMRYDYDMLGNRVHQLSMEAGERWILNDVAGKPLYAWDSRNHRVRTAYDRLRRPVESFLQKGSTPEILIGRILYGEGQGDPEAKNQRGKVVQLFDQAGIVTTEDYDFKGNLLQSRRQLTQNYRTTVDWFGPVPLESEVYTSRTAYDALNRPLSVTTPDNSVHRPTFNEANLLNKVEINLRGVATATTFVTNIDYNAKGQRERIDYDNGTTTTYVYDPETFRLTALVTTRIADHARLQDLHYTYDPAGNITRIRDEAQQTIYFNNQVIEPDCAYTYDAIYRLIEATGREHIGQAAKPQTTWNDEGRVKLAHPQDGQAMRRYQERYLYDPVGNFEQIVHAAVNGNWTRDYAYNEPSLIEPGKQGNRLSGTTVGSSTPETESFSYDQHGNMLNMAHLPSMRWDFQDQLQQVDLGGGGTAYYVYDAAGQRVRKVIERQNGTRQKERIYLGGFEIYQEYDGAGSSVSLARETLHVMDDKQRIALVETKTIDTQDPALSTQHVLRYQFGNHLGSASLELDDVGKMISYEEYHPYGTTSYQAVRSGVEVSAKRYRYTGKERDEETGLYYHGARYYAPWLERWTSVDPGGLADGINGFQFVRNNPINLTDPAGTQSWGEVALKKQADEMTKSDKVLVMFDDGKILAVEKPIAEMIQAVAMRREIELARKYANQKRDYLIRNSEKGGTVLRNVTEDEARSEQERQTKLRRINEHELNMAVVEGLLAGAGAVGARGAGNPEVVGGPPRGATQWGARTTSVQSSESASTGIRPSGTPGFETVKPERRQRAPIVVSTGTQFNATADVRYTPAMARDPSSANFARAAIEFGQQGGRTILRTSERHPDDAAARTAARAQMDVLGVSRIRRDAMHPVDSILNPYFDPNSGAYYFGHRSVNRSLGAQLGNQLSGTISGVPVWVRFHGFPSYDQVRPIAPRGPF
ncbi:MAG: hypothetical protein NW703_15000 [Nitrospiraceae bacterium]